MRYTKPTILSTVNANAAVQDGAHNHMPKSSAVPDNLVDSSIQSTSGAYEADE